jgi:hypothetical protein
VPIPHADFHEIWWIYSPINGREWAGLRIAQFRKSTAGDDIVIIQGELDQRRIGPRLWQDIRQTECWYKVQQIPIPSIVQIMAAALPDDVEPR